MRTPLLAGVTILAALLVVPVADAKPTAEPNSVTLPVTRLWGPFSGKCVKADKGAVWLRGASAVELPTTSLVGSDQGGRGRVALSEKAAPEFTPPAGVRAGSVAVVDHMRPGSYSGSVPLGDDGAVKVKVLVQDFIIWPVLVVLIGVLIGGLGTRSYAWRRRRTMLLGSLMEAVERYSDERSKAVTLGGAYSLDWPAPTELPGAAACKNKKDPIVDPVRQVEQVWCAVLSAAGDEELDRVTPQVAALRAGLDRCLELNFELRRLSAVASELAQHELLPYEDALLLAGEMATPPSDEKARLASIFRIRQQANVLGCSGRVVGEVQRGRSMTMSEQHR